MAIDRQNQIISAAQGLFLQQGLRGASMEAIARAAGVAKPTLYRYFPDKEAVFAAVARVVVAQLRDLVRAQLDREGDVAARIGAALAAKCKAIFKLLDGSPHADEIFWEKHFAGAAPLAGFEKWVLAEVTQVLMMAGFDHAHRDAHLILACTDGILRRARDAAEVGPAVRHMVAKILA